MKEMTYYAALSDVIACDLRREKSTTKEERFQKARGRIDQNRDLFLDSMIAHLQLLGHRGIG